MTIQILALVYKTITLTAELSRFE